MEKEQNPKPDNPETEEEAISKESQNTPSNRNNDEETNSENLIDKSPEEKILDLEDRLARTFAEMENQRRRFEKEKEEAFEYGGFAFAKEALNLIDNLERSKKILENDDELKNSNVLKKTLDHLDIINKDLMSIFIKNNIKPIESLNKKLDPNFHQAMMEIEDDTKEAGTIIQEIHKGFTIKDRLLRPSLVGVSKKTENKSKKNEENKGDLENK